MSYKHDPDDSYCECFCCEFNGGNKKAKMRNNPFTFTKRSGAKIDLCCEYMHKAFFSGTDNESYGALADNHGCTPDSITIGCDLPELSFCPWCGFDIHGIIESEKAENERVEYEPNITYAWKPIETAFTFDNVGKRILIMDKSNMVVSAMMLSGSLMTSMRDPVLWMPFPTIPTPNQ